MRKYCLPPDKVVLFLVEASEGELSKSKPLSVFSLKSRLIIPHNLMPEMADTITQVVIHVVESYRVSI